MGEQRGEQREKPGAYLLALTNAAARDYAEDHGWAREGPADRGCYRRPDGVLVKVVYSAEAFDGKPLGCAVHLGYRHDERHDWPRLRRMIEAGRITVAEERAWT
jgi:hypothetical protein